METREALGDRPTSTDSVLQNLLNRVFRCRHHRKTFPFTPRGEDQCYAVCLDCGQRLGSDLQEIGRALKPDSPTQPVRETGQPRSPQTEAGVRTTLPPKPAVDRSTAPDLQLRNWKYDLLWVGLFVVGLSGGLYLTDRIRQSAAQLALPEPRLLPVACYEPSTASPKSNGTAPSVQKAVAQTTDVAPAPPSVPKLAAADGSESSHITTRLVSKTSVAVLGLEASAVTELTEHPDRLGDLIQSGSLFTVPSGTPIQVLETENGVLRVEILQGSMAGREGWARGSQVMPRYRSKDQPRSRELRQLGEH